MLSFETEDRIAKFLLFISDNHQSIDLLRRELNSQISFDPFCVYTRLDRAYKGHIDYMDLIFFFKDHMIYCSADEARSIIAWYDSDGDSILSYGEFIQMILADETRSVPNEVFNCNCRDIRGVTLPFAIENLVLEVLEKELRFNRVVKDMLLDIRCRFDFTPQGVFKALGGNVIINKEGIRTFLIRNKMNFIEKDIDIIARKLDIENKRRINLKDIEIIFNIFDSNATMYPSHTNSIDMSVMTNNATCNSSFDKQPQEQKSIPPPKNNTVNESTNRSNINTISNGSPIKTWSSQHSIINGLRERPFPPVTSLSSLVVDLLELIYHTEISLESLKCSLALRNDFNVDDAFIVFEHHPSSTNELNELDISTGLSALGIFPTASELKLLIRRYSLLKTSTLNYGDFFDMLVPFDKDFRNIVERRPPSPFVPKFNRSDFFLGETKTLLADLMEKAIVSENKIEVIRKRISKSFGVDVREFIREIDEGKKGYLSVDDLRKFVKEKINTESSDKDADLLFIRLDRDRDGKVQYEDIIYESREYYSY